MTISRTRRRTVGGLTALTVVLGLSACGDQGVMHRGDTAATLGGNTVTTSEVQDALGDLQKIAPNANITGARVAAVLALAPRVNEVATAHGARISPEQAKATLRESGSKVDPSQGALEVLATENELSKLVNGTSAQQNAINRVLNSADVKMNPRYGQWGKGGSYGPAPTDWIVPTKPETDPGPVPNGRPAQ